MKKIQKYGSVLILYGGPNMEDSQTRFVLIPKVGPNEKHLQTRFRFNSEWRSE